jgi:hypothetical protein
MESTGFSGGRTLAHPGQAAINDAAINVNIAFDPITRLQ